MKSEMVSALSLRFIKTLMLFAIVGTTFLGTAVFSSSEALADKDRTKTAFANYKGTDGVWHHVTVYKDNVTGVEYSSEWIHGHGPFIHNPPKFPSWPYGVSVGGNEGGNKPLDSVGVLPIDLYCEFVATADGTMNLVTDEIHINVEISDIQGNVLMERTPINRGSNSIKVPAGFSTKYPYGITFYRGEGPVYGMMFWFNGEKYHTQKELHSPSIDAKPDMSYEEAVKAAKAGK